MNGYIAGGEEYHYPGAGDPAPERSDAKVLLLTRAGICVTGHWDGNPFYLGWKELPKRNRDKESLVLGLERAAQHGTPKT